MNIKSYYADIEEDEKMSSDAQVFASAAAIQHQAQRAGLKWLEGKLCNYRPEIYEEVRKAYLRGFKVRKKCVLICLPIPLIICVCFFLHWVGGLDRSQMVYGHVDGNEIWYIRGEKKTLDCREVGYMDADNEVVIYLDHNDEFEKVISRSKLEAQEGRDIAGVLISWSLGTVLLICAIRYCENKYCWQFKLFWKWYDRFIRNKDLDIEEFINIYETELRRRNCQVA